MASVEVVLVAEAEQVEVVVAKVAETGTPATPPFALREVVVGRHTRPATVVAVVGHPLTLVVVAVGPFDRRVLTTVVVVPAPVEPRPNGLVAALDTDDAVATRLVDILVALHRARPSAIEPRVLTKAVTPVVPGRRGPVPPSRPPPGGTPRRGGRYSDGYCTST